MKISKYLYRTGNRKKIQEILIFVPSINDSKSGIDIKKIVSEF